MFIVIFVLMALISIIIAFAYFNHQNKALEADWLSHYDELVLYLLHRANDAGISLQIKDQHIQFGVAGDGILNGYLTNMNEMILFQFAVFNQLYWEDFYDSIENEYKILKQNETIKQNILDYMNMKCYRSEC